MMEIYTIGYVSYTPEKMIKVLWAFGISCLIDVRSSPYSAYYKQFDRDILSKKLREAGIIYRNYAREFGARQEDLRFFSDEGYLDFDLFTRSEQFHEGVDKVRKGMKLGYTFALMCAEKDPMTCHRAIMIGKNLKEQGFRVRHILYPDQIETQEEMEQRAIGNQLSFFPEERIADFYREQNRKIGYRSVMGKVEISDERDHEFGSVLGDPKDC